MSTYSIWHRVFKDWTSFTISKQLLIKFSFLTLVSFGTFVLMILIYVSVLNNQIYSLIHSHLLQQAQQDMLNVNTDAVNLIQAKFAAPAHNSALLQRFALENTYRSDFPYPYQPFHYEWRYAMAQPVQYITRYNSYLSFADGGFNVGQFNPSPGLPYTAQTYNPSPLLTAAINRTASQAESTVPTLKSVYWTEGGPYTGAIISLYACWSAHGELFEYPAASNGNISQLASYDCRNDAWYKQGVACTTTNVNNPCYTPAYVDPWVKEVEFSIVMAFRNRLTGQVMGSIGNDLITDSIQSSIASITYLQHGRAILFDTSDGVNGFIMCDSARPLNQQLLTLFNYNQIPGIPISQSQWSTMLSSSSGFVDLGDYIAQAQFLPQTGSGTQYTLVIFTLKDDLTGPLSSIQNDISNNNIKIIWITVVVFVVVLVSVSFLMYHLIRGIAVQIQELADVSNEMVNNIGSGDLSKGIDMNRMNRVGAYNVHADLHINPLRQNVEETQILARNIRQLILSQAESAASQSNHSADSNGLSLNPMFGQLQQWAHILPPPPSYNEAVKIERDDAQDKEDDDDEIMREPKFVSEDLFAVHKNKAT